MCINAFIMTTKKSKHKVKTFMSLGDLDLIQPIRQFVLFFHFTSKHEQNVFSLETRSLCSDKRSVTSLMHHLSSVDSNKNKVGTLSTMLYYL